MIALYIIIAICIISTGLIIAYQDFKKNEIKQKYIYLNIVSILIYLALLNYFIAAILLLISIIFIYICIKLDKPLDILYLLLTLITIIISRTKLSMVYVYIAIPIIAALAVACMSNIIIKAAT